MMRLTQELALVHLGEEPVKRPVSDLRDVGYLRGRVNVIEVKVPDGPTSNTRTTKSYSGQGQTLAAPFLLILTMLLGCPRHGLSLSAAPFTGWVAARARLRQEWESNPRGTAPRPLSRRLH